MLRWLTAGESHGPELVAILEGLPAGIPVSLDSIRADLARRKLGYGRGARMKFEQDELAISGGVRHGVSLGSPIALRIGNTEWPKWQEVMSPEPVDPAALGRGRGAPLTRPRPGHADLVGMQKYDFDEARPVLERASARETAARVALGAVARAFLAELGIRLVAHTLSIGPVARARGQAAADARRRRPARRRPAALLRPRDIRRHGRRGRPRPQRRRHARRRRRGARVRRAAGAGLVRALGPPARLAARGRAHGHPGHQGRRGRRRVPDDHATRFRGARRTAPGRRPHRAGRATVQAAPRAACPRAPCCACAPA